MVPLTREGGETTPGPAVLQGALQMALAGGAPAHGLLLATCLPRPSGPPAGTRTCPSSASQRATCKKETEAGKWQEIVPGGKEQPLSWQGHALDVWLRA